MLGASDDGNPCRVDIPLLTHDELVMLAENRKKNLLVAAQATISVWQSQLLLGIISDDNKKQLVLWLGYIDLLLDVDTSNPEGITWPAQPTM